jgi:CheY-like chemotaxis protein
MKVLVVDDLEANRAVLVWLLAEDGHEVIEAENGQEAVDLFQQEQPDLVLMDVIMPVLDGIEATRAIKAIVTSSYVPIIFLTALDNEVDLKRCLDAGGDDFLSKPFSETVLKSKIKAHSRIQALGKQLTQQHLELTYLHNHMIKEQEMAELVFHQAMKSNLTECRNIRTHISPASSFNGDVLLSADSPVGSVYILIGDFTGHGLPASIGTLPLSQTFFAMTKKAMSVGDIASEINTLLSRLLPDHMFCACTILELNQTGDRIAVWSGGMLDGYIVSQENGLERRIESMHMPLGVMNQDEFDSRYEIIELSPNQMLYFYTDGIPETENVVGEFFGQERLESLFVPGKENHFDDILYGVQAFRGNLDQNDDITLLLLKAGPIEFEQGFHFVHSSETFDMLMPWKIEVQLEGNQIATYEPVPYLMELIGEHPSLRQHKEFVGLLLSELYANALDHGVLGLSSIDKKTEEGFVEFYQKRSEGLSNIQQGFIHIKLELDVEAKSLEIEVKDSGKGFDFKHHNDQEMIDDNTFGRGLPMMQTLCHDVQYLEQGTRVKVSYSLDKAA